MIFKANYFDGRSSRTYPATIETNNNSWIITFTESSGKTIKINWLIKQIKKSDVYTKNMVCFSYGDNFPFQKIESNHSLFINYISKSNHQNINNKLDLFLHQSVNKSILILLLILISFSIGTYFYVIPTITLNFTKNLPKEKVIEFGDYVFNTLSSTLDINTVQSKKLQNFVNSLETETEFPITAYVVKNEQLNAFALSGGKFIIYTGLLNKIKTEHQLTALISHELSHIENRHILKNISRNLSGALFISILFGDVSGITSIMAENAHMFSQLSFNRSLEKEADIFGLKLMRENNLDLQGMPQLFEILKQHNQINTPSFLNSHPMLNERIEYTRNIAKSQKAFTPNIEIQEKWEDLKKTLPLN